MKHKTKKPVQPLLFDVPVDTSRANPKMPPPARIPVRLINGAQVERAIAESSLPAGKKDQKAQKRNAAFQKWVRTARYVPFAPGMCGVYMTKETPEADRNRGGSLPERPLRMDYPLTGHEPPWLPKFYLYCGPMVGPGMKFPKWAVEAAAQDPRVIELVLNNHRKRK